MIRAVEGGLGVHHLSGRPHHHHRRADEGLRGSGGHRRARRRRRCSWCASKARNHAVLAACRQGPSALVSEASASTSCRRGGSRSPDGVTGRARRAALRRALGDEMVRTVFETAPASTTTLFDALLEARRQHGGGHVVVDDIEFAADDVRQLVTGSLALGGALAGAYAPGRARRRAAADVARRGRDVLRPPGRRTRAGDAQLLDRPGVRAGRVPRRRRSRWS